MADPETIPLEGDSSVTIENPDAPVNMDLSIAPPIKTEVITTKDGDIVINIPEGETK